MNANYIHRKENIYIYINKWNKSVIVRSNNDLNGLIQTKDLGFSFSFPSKSYTKRKTISNFLNIYQTLGETNWIH